MEVMTQLWFIKGWCLSKSWLEELELMWPNTHTNLRYDSVVVHQGSTLVTYSIHPPASLSNSIGNHPSYLRTYIANLILHLLPTSLCYLLTGSPWSTSWQRWDFLLSSLTCWWNKYPASLLRPWTQEKSQRFRQISISLWRSQPYRSW